MMLLMLPYPFHCRFSAAIEVAATMPFFFDADAGARFLLIRRY